jgi:4-amino-4-deoxy-L-arabinose transferase-like glycosyltransferase
MRPYRTSGLTPSGRPDAPRKLSGRLALVAVVGAAVLSFNFGSRLLLTNDDTRFPVMARDVLVNGHWLVPLLPDGTPIS